MNAAHVGGHGKGFPALSYLGLFRVTGPLLSLVLRTEDVWQRYNQFLEAVRALRSDSDTVASVLVCGMVTVQNGHFTMHTGDLVQWYFDFEQAKFEDNNKNNGVCVGLLLQDL